MGKTYSKTKEELMVLINNLVDQHGHQLKIPLIKLDQGNSYDMFASKMSVGASYSFLRRIPRDYDNVEGIQRALKDKKINSISDSALNDKEKYSSPNAVVVTLKKSNIDYVEFVNDPNNTELAYYTIDLNKYQSHVFKAEVDQEGYLLNEHEVFPGTLIDGHHRTAGLLEAGRFNFETPVTVYIELPHKDTARVFSEINEHQEKPSPVHTLAMRAIAGILGSDEERANQIMNKLNTKSDSILKDRIKSIDGKRPKHLPKYYITSSTFVKLLRQYILDEISDLNSEEQTRILNNYFTAWSKVFPEAWNDTSSHVLVKSMGFQIMMRLFSTIYQGVLKPGVIPEADFEEFIQETIGNDSYLPLGDEQTIPINWESSIYGGYSSGKGINAITTALKRYTLAKRRELFSKQL